MPRRPVPLTVPADESKPIARRRDRDGRAIAAAPAIPPLHRRAARGDDGGERSSCATRGNVRIPRRARPADSAIDEGPRRSRGRQTLRRALAVREPRHSQRDDRPAAADRHGDAHATPGARRHHHAERPVLRAPPRWRAVDRSGTAPAAAARHGPLAPALHGRRPAPVSLGVAHPFPRVLGQSDLQEALWQDGLGHRRPGELRRVDGRSREDAARRGRPAAGREVGDRRRRRRGGE